MWIVLKEFLVQILSVRPGVVFVYSTRTREFSVRRRYTEVVLLYFYGDQEGWWRVYHYKPCVCVKVSICY